MNFSKRIGDVELRSCSESFDQEGEHTTAQIVEWHSGGSINRTLAYWKLDKNGYYLVFSWDKPFNVNRKVFINLASLGQNILDYSKYIIEDL